MFYERLHVTFVGVLATLVDSVVVAEFAGYWLHRLLHSDKIPALSRGHLIHHFLSMAPANPCAPTNTTTPRTIAFRGQRRLEWLVPSGVILLFCWGVMALLHVPQGYEVLALCTLLGWPILMFSYLHDRMHVENFWMAKVPGLRTWFLKARRLHDIHHKSLDSDALWMPTLASAFYFFDRIFGTMTKRHRPFNWCGYKTAAERYGLDETELVSLRSCSKSSFKKRTARRMARFLTRP